MTVIDRAPSQADPATAGGTGKTIAPDPLQGRTRAPRAVEGWVVFAIAFVAFAGLGYLTVISWNIVGFQSLDKLTRALMVWHNNPPNLSAVGFDFPPLTVLAFLPLTLFPIVASSFWALPLSSAFFGALALVILNRTFAWMQVPRGLRYVALALIAANPLVAFYGSNGASDMLSVSLLLLAIANLLLWSLSNETKHIMVSGLTFGIAVVADYDAIWWALLGAVMVGGILWSRKATQDAVQAFVITFIAPILYVLALWTLFNWIIMSDPFAWLGRSDGLFSILTGHGLTGPTGDTLAASAQYTLWLVIAASALTVLVLPLLVITAVSQKDGRAGWLAAFIGLAILLPFLRAVLTDDSSQVVLRDGLPLFVLTLVGAAYMFRTVASGTRGPLSIVLVLGIAGSALVSWWLVPAFPNQNLESNFVSAVLTGQNQEGTTTQSGQQVGILSERAMAEYITANVSNIGSVLTDNSETYGVMLLTGRPELFFDRVDEGDAKWLEAVENPPSTVQYILVATEAGEDEISAVYPGITGNDASFDVAYDSGRYKLVRVTEELRRIAVPYGTVPQSDTTDATNTDATNTDTTVTTEGAGTDAQPADTTTSGS